MKNSFEQNHSWPKVSRLELREHVVLLLACYCSNSVCTQCAHDLHELLALKLWCMLCTYVWTDMDTLPAVACFQHFAVGLEPEAPLPAPCPRTAHPAGDLSMGDALPIPSLLVPPNILARLPLCSAHWSASNPPTILNHPMISQCEGGTLKGNCLIILAYAAHIPD